MRETVRSNLSEILAEHSKDTDNPSLCRMCGAADGSYPCVTRKCATEALRALEEAIYYLED